MYPLTPDQKSLQARARALAEGTFAARAAAEIAAAELGHAQSPPLPAERRDRVLEEDGADMGALRAAFMKNQVVSSIAGEFVANRAIVGVVGHVTSGAMMAAAPVYEQGLVAIATTASSPDLSGISSWTFRVISSDSANGIAMARFASARGFRRAAILFENNSYGRGLAESFRRLWLQLVAFVPRLAVAVLLLVAGWILAKGLRRLTVRALRLLRLLRLGCRCTVLMRRRSNTTARIGGAIGYLARDGKRFYQYNDLNGLNNSAGHNNVTIREGWFFEPGTSRLYVRSQDDPNAHIWQAPRLNHAFDVIARDWIWIEGFEMRFYGTSTNGCGVCTLNASHLAIRRNRIHNMQLGIFVQWNGADSQGNDTRIEFNEVFDTPAASWEWSAIKNGPMEGTGIIVRGHIGAIVRGNEVHHTFNGIYAGTSGTGWVEEVTREFKATQREAWGAVAEGWNPTEWQRAVRAWVERPAQRAYLEVLFDSPEIYRLGCDDWYRSARLRACTFGPAAAARHLVIVGDSVGLQWFSALRQAFAAQILQANPYAYRGALRALAFFNVLDSLAKIQAPALVVTGEHDRTIPPDVQRLLDVAAVVMARRTVDMTNDEAALFRELGARAAV